MFERIEIKMSLFCLATCSVELVSDKIFKGLLYFTFCFQPMWLGIMQTLNDPNIYCACALNAIIPPFSLHHCVS